MILLTRSLGLAKMKIVLTIFGNPDTQHVNKTQKQMKVTLDLDSFGP